MKKAITITVFIITCFVTSLFGQGWQWSAGGTGCSEGNAFTNDIWGNAYAAGYSHVLSTSLVFGPVTLTNLGLSSAVVVKYGPNGNLLWAKSTHNGFTRPVGIRADPYGNLYLLGYYTSATLGVGPFTLSKPAVDSELFIAKYSSSGNVVWAKNLCSGNVSGGIDINGNDLFITSSYDQPSVSLGAFTLFNNDPFGLTYDFFVAKLDTSGNVVWANSWGGSGSEYSTAIAATTSGNVYISGTFGSPSVSFGSNTLLTSVISGFLVKYSSSGTPLWAKITGGKSPFQTNVATDASENAFVTGTYYRTSLNFGSTVLTTDSFSSIFIAKYDRNGVVSWATKVMANFNVFGYGITADLCGNVWISGNMPQGDTGFISIDGSRLHVPADSKDPAFIAEWSPAGEYVTSTALPTGGDDASYVGTDGAGNVYFCSDYFGGPFTIGGVKLEDPNHIYEDIFVAKYAKVIDTERTSTLVCMTDSTVLQAPPGYVAYQWNDGSALAARTVNSPGTYSLFCIGQCNKGVRNEIFKVDHGHLDTAYMRTDTSICLNSQIALVAPPGYDPYHWSDGSATQNDTISAPGGYLAICSGTCTIPTLFDSFFVSYNFTDLAFSLGNDTSVCTPYLIQAHISGVSYFWQDSTTRNSDLAEQQGVYHVTVSYQGCFNSDSVNVYFPDLTQHLRDTVVCKEKPVQINFKANAPNGSNVLWSTGSTEHQITATAAGKYWVTVTDAACAASDTVTIGLKYCYCTAFLPDAFTPNDDGLNDFFHPIIDVACNIYDYSFCIYNRWGQMIYATHDPSAKWNGKFNNIPQDIGVYMYYLEYRAGSSLYTHSYKGDVTLIR